MPNPTAEQFRALKQGAKITAGGKQLTFVRFRAGKATCIDADGKRVNILVEKAPASAPPVQTGETEEDASDGEGRTGGR
jgi:hypothetical protein